MVQLTVKTVELLGNLEYGMRTCPVVNGQYGSMPINLQDVTSNLQNYTEFRGSVQKIHGARVFTFSKNVSLCNKMSDNQYICCFHIVGYRANSSALTKYLLEVSESIKDQYILESSTNHFQQFGNT